MSIKILSGIYAIRNTLNGRIYVGAAVSFTERWRLHRFHLNRGTHHCPPLQHAWAKDGETAFDFEITEPVEREEDLIPREQVHLNGAFATGLPYNIARKARSSLGLTGWAKPLHEGERFGRLVVIKFDGSRKSRTRAGASYRKLYYLCRCDCGNQAHIERGNLKSGNTVSCGCLHREEISRVNRTHGKSSTREHRAWAHMIGRCFCPTDTSYKYYGARGIIVCERWRDSFTSFLADMGTNPGKGYSLERIDNDGNYEPGNCRWATPREQAGNTTRSRWITFNGKRATLADWIRTTGIPLSTLRYRLAGWPLERALTEPARTLKRRALGSGLK